ncbi:tetratricopeptide repeat protein [Candidatus Sumerlaeota bacterium]|nr:tetratricopeptide repeat protein [Candidatus Sumerlaeales bacterium]NLD62054.1 tetratricopeptide repeat protein [Candidatus Sumerlaeota bacterium]
MLRVVANKARHHYNIALEHAERGRTEDAIDELHNALDLNAKLIPAHNLLGTLLARQGNVEEARKSWESALQVDPNTAKSYNYLNRLETMRESLPMIERLQQVCLALVLVVCILVAVLFYLGRTDPAQQLITEAQEAYDKKQYGEALELLNQATVKRNSSDTTQVAADSLRRAITSSVDVSLKQIRDFSTRNEYNKAIAAISELEKNGPDQATSKVLEMLRTEVHDQFRNSIASLQNEYEEGKAEYSTLTKRITDFLELYPEVLEKDSLRQDLAKARDIEVKRRVDKIRQEFDKNNGNDGAVENAISSLQLLGTEFPGSEALTRERKRFVADLLLFCYDRLNTEMQEQQYDLAQRHLIELANFAGEFQDIVNYTTIIPMLEERLVQGIKDQQLLLTEQYIREKDYDAADEALRELLLASDLLTSGELAILREYVDRLNSEECADEVKQIVDQMKSYLDLTIDDSIAQQTVNDYQHILDVSPKMNSTQKTRLLACAVAAASKLDDDTEARAAFEKYLRAAPQATLTRDLRRLNPALRNVRGQ